MARSPGRPVQPATPRRAIRSAQKRTSRSPVPAGRGRMDRPRDDSRSDAVSPRVAEADPRGSGFRLGRVVDSIVARRIENGRGCETVFDGHRRLGLRSGWVGLAYGTLGMDTRTRIDRLVANRAANPGGDRGMEVLGVHQVGSVRGRQRSGDAGPARLAADRERRKVLRDRTSGPFDLARDGRTINSVCRRHSGRRRSRRRLRRRRSRRRHSDRRLRRDLP